MTKGSTSSSSKTGSHSSQAAVPVPNKQTQAQITDHARKCNPNSNAYWETCKVPVPAHNRVKPDWAGQGRRLWEERGSPKVAYMYSVYYSNGGPILVFVIYHITNRPFFKISILHQKMSPNCKKLQHRQASSFLLNSPSISKVDLVDKWHDTNCRTHRWSLDKVIDDCFQTFACATQVFFQTLDLEILVIRRGGPVRSSCVSGFSTDWQGD